MTTEQEVFDKAVQHLLTQNAKSLTNEGCAYRGNGGLMCGVGPFIKDECYTEEMEGSSAGRLFNDWPEALTFERDENIEQLLRLVQNVHDWSQVEDWSDRLQRLGEARGLTFNPPKVPA